MNTAINDQIFQQFPELESERLIFRAFELKDAADLFFMRSNDQVMQYMDIEKHQSIKDAEAMISTIHKNYKEKTGINWAIIEKSTQSFIGYVCFWKVDHQHCRGELGYALKPTYWGKGIMSETLPTFIPFAFKELTLHSIKANVNTENKKSEQLLIKFGFKKEAHFREDYLFKGQFLDSLIYCLLESDVE